MPLPYRDAFSVCYCKILRSSDSDLETTHNTFCACLVLLNAFSDNFACLYELLFNLILF